MHAFFLADLLSGFGINLWAFISQLVSFAIVFLILWRWGFPVILRTLDRRQAVIREGVENAERARRDLTEATARAEQFLQQAPLQRQRTIELSTSVRGQEA